MGRSSPVAPSRYFCVLPPSLNSLSCPDCAKLKREYPELEDDDIPQALRFSARSVDAQLIVMMHGSSDR